MKKVTFIIFTSFNLAFSFEKNRLDAYWKDISFSCIMWINWFLMNRVCLAFQCTLNGWHTRCIQCVSIFAKRLSYGRFAYSPLRALGTYQLSYLTVILNYFFFMWLFLFFPLTLYLLKDCSIHLYCLWIMNW